MGFGIWKNIKRGVSKLWNAGKKVVGKIFGNKKDDKRNNDPSDIESDF